MTQLKLFTDTTDMNSKVKQWKTKFNMKNILNMKCKVWQLIQLKPLTDQTNLLHE